MVPISKSIWPLILFVYLNLHFMLMIRFNLLYCFSKIFFRERSKQSPPNFASPFCALCLNVCDFLPKTWNLGRKLPLSRCATAPPRGRLSALPQSFLPPLKPSPWGRWLRPAGADGRGSPPDSGLALSGAPAPALPKGEPRSKARC